MLTKLYVWLCADFFAVKANFGQRQQGATLIEYVLIVAVIAIAVFAAASFGLGDAITGIFTQAETTISGASSE